MRDFSYAVRLPDESTRICVGPLADVQPGRAAETGCLIAEAAVHAASGAVLGRFAARMIASPAEPLVLEGGESAKTPASVARIWEELARRGLDRGSLVIAAGGGATLDACGFAAATFLRGVALAAVPTTLLAQVDAALGGKSAVNLDGAKNQVGAIRQPVLVAVDPAFVARGPEAAFRPGLGELAKCALLAGGELHDLVVGRAAALCARDPAVLEEAVWNALRHKAGVVSRDPLDRGERAVLNAGHSVGHVIEAEALRLGVRLPHGDAVAIGLCVEARAHARADAAAVRRVVGALGLPSAMPFAVAPGRARALLERDKKHRGGIVRLPVIENPGAPVLFDVPVAALLEAMAADAAS